MRESGKGKVERSLSRQQALSPHSLLPSPNSLSNHQPTFCPYTFLPVLIRPGLFSLAAFPFSFQVWENVVPCLALHCIRLNGTELCMDMLNLFIHSQWTWVFSHLWGIINGASANTRVFVWINVCSSLRCVLRGWIVNANSAGCF